MPEVTDSTKFISLPKSTFVDGARSDALQGPRTAQQGTPDKQTPNTGDLALPWRHGDYSFFEVKSAEIRFLVGASSDKGDDLRKNIPALAKQIAAANLQIKDPQYRVTTCVIAPTTGRFALWQQKPVLMLEPEKATPDNAIHEMSHAIFYFLEKRAESKNDDALQANKFRLSVADIYFRLSQTKIYQPENSEGHAAGFWMVDPSEWNPLPTDSEHPWDDPDEFFASAREAYEVNRKALEGTITRFKKIDAAIEVPAKDLLKLLDKFGKNGTLSAIKLSKEQALVAKSQLERVKGVSNVEKTIGSSPLLDWLLNPEKRPGQRERAPSDSAE